MSECKLGAGPDAWCSAHKRYEIVCLREKLVAAEKQISALNDFIAARAKDRVADLIVAEKRLACNYGPSSPISCGECKACIREKLVSECALADRLAKAVRPKCGCTGYEMCPRYANVDSALAAYDEARKVKP